jgi:hypothetical protein
MKDLSFNTGMMELAIQGDPNRVLRFNPSDSKIADGFLSLVAKTNEKLRELGKKEKEIQQLNLTDLEKAKSMTGLNLEIDIFFRNELDAIFGKGSAQIAFENLCTSATTENGDCVFVNFIYAILPYFEKEIKERNKKIAKIIEENRA